MLAPFQTKNSICAFWTDSRPAEAMEVDPMDLESHSEEYTKAKEIMLERTPRARRRRRQLTAWTRRTTLTAFTTS